MTSLPEEDAKIHTSVDMIPRFCKKKWEKTWGTSGKKGKIKEKGVKMRKNRFLGLGAQNLELPGMGPPGFGSRVKLCHDL